MIFHLVLNSLLVFVILTFLIDFFLLVFKVDNARVRYVCRLFPILKFPFDLLIFGFYGEPLFVNFNPFSCEVYVQEFLTNLMSSHIKTELPPGEPFIIPKYLAMHVPSLWLNGIISTIVLLSLIILTRKIYLFITSRTYLKNVLQFASPCTRPIFNPNLINQLKRKNALILTSEQVQIPFAANLHYIFLPNDLVSELSQEEFEAVVVHELEHLRWKDPVLKMASGLICALFWWLPSTWWLKRLEAEQEDACDAEVYRYGIDIYALATAMVKVVKRAKYLTCPFSAMCPFDSPKNSHLKRLKKILNSTPQKNMRWQHLFGVMVCFFTFICFWMC